MVTPGHAIEQPPQLAGSLVVSTQDEPHAVPLEQVDVHAPPLQSGWLAEHAVPQAPQLVELLCVFTHAPLQFTKP